MSDIKFCLYCLRVIKKEKVTVEHLLPISRGGNNSSHNRRVCCKDCNEWRGNVSHAKWARIIRTLLHKGKVKEGYSRSLMMEMVERIKNISKYMAKENVIKKLRRDDFIEKPVCSSFGKGNIVDQESSKKKLKINKIKRNKKRSTLQYKIKKEQDRQNSLEDNEN